MSILYNQLTNDYSWCNTWRILNSSQEEFEIRSQIDFMMRHTNIASLIKQDLKPYVWHLEKAFDFKSYKNPLHQILNINTLHQRREERILNFKLETGNSYRQNSFTHDVKRIESLDINSKRKSDKAIIGPSGRQSYLS